MIDRLDNHLFFSRLVGGAMTQKWKGNPCSGYLGPDIQLAIMVPLKIMTVPHLGKGPHLLLAAQIEVLISIGGISMSRVKMSWQSQRQVLLMYCNTFEKLHFTTFNLQKYVDDKSMLVVARTIFQILSNQKFSIVQQTLSSCVKMSLNFSKAIS